MVIMRSVLFIDSSNNHLAEAVLLRGNNIRCYGFFLSLSGTRLDLDKNTVFPNNPKNPDPSYKI